MRTISTTCICSVQDSIDAKSYRLLQYAMVTQSLITTNFCRLGAAGMGATRASLHLVALSPGALRTT